MNGEFAAFSLIKNDAIINRMSEECAATFIIKLLVCLIVLLEWLNVVDLRKNLFLYVDFSGAVTLMGDLISKDYFLRNFIFVIFLLTQFPMYYCIAIAIKSRPYLLFMFVEATFILWAKFCYCRACLCCTSRCVNLFLITFNSSLLN